MSTPAPLSETVKKLLSVAQRARVCVTDEKRAQAELAVVFADAGIIAEREVVLSPRDIVDFMVDGVAIELKIKGSRKAIYRQLERYAEHDRVHEILLLTSRCMSLPDTINGRPAAVGSLSLAWLA